MENDAKQVQEVADDFDTKADAFFAETETETPSESSTENQPEETEVTEPTDTSAETENTEPSEEKEAEVPKEFHKHPAWQRILKERDEARKSMEELKTQFPKEELEKFNKVVSSPAFIKAQMQAEGYTQEAINKKLTEMGYESELPPQDDVNLVLKSLNIDPSSLNEEAKHYVNTYIADAAKVADIILRDRLNKLLPKELEPLKKGLGEIEQRSMGNKLAQDIQNTVKSEGILDFEKEVEPVLIDYLDKNPNATQKDVYDFFRDINHRLTIEKLKTKGKKEARDEKKASLRQNVEGANLSNLNIEKSGDFDKDADAFFNALGIN